MSHFDWFKRLADDGDGSDEDLPLDGIWDSALYNALLHPASDFKAGDRVQDVWEGRWYVVTEIHAGPWRWAVLERVYTKAKKNLYLDGPFADDHRHWLIERQ